MDSLKTFSGIYPISKTLRFELIPDSRTKEFLESSDLIKRDEHRAESYKAVKKIIDRYHKSFINDVLSKVEFKYEQSGKFDSLEEFEELYLKPQKTDADKKNLTKVQDNLRKFVVNYFISDERYKKIDKQELFKEISKDVSNEDKVLVEEFEKFYTYFTGFHENRKNMYSSEAQSTAIAYRIIHENLPKFIDNITSFNKILNSQVAEKLPELQENMKDFLKGVKIEDMFKLNFYNFVLAQTPEVSTEIEVTGIDLYNAIIGGRTLDDGTKIQGINEYVNLYNQCQPSRETRLPKLKPLFKQILSDRVSLSWLPEEFYSDNDLLEAINEFYKSIKDNILPQIREILTNITEYCLDNIYVANDLSLTDISQKLYGDWGIITKSIVEILKIDNPQKKNEKTEKYEERIAKLFKSNDSFNISFLNACLQNKEKNICTYFSNLGAINTENKQTENLLLQIESAYTAAKELLENDYPTEKNLAQDKENVAKLKTLLDAVKALQHFIKPLLGAGNEANKDERFYAELSFLWENLSQITPLYNKVRNRMTRKPYSVEKFKLNFDNSTLLNGWDVNKECANSCVILRKNGLFYLAIMQKKFNRIFVDAPETKDFTNSYEKMDYKLLPGPNKMLPKVFITSEKGKAQFKPSQSLLEHYAQGTHKKGENFCLEDCHELIDFFKSSISKHEDWCNFDFNFSPTSSYKDLSGFYREVEQMGYKISFRNIPDDYIDKMVSEGKLFLFQIYNKDFSKFSTGTPNLHTLYWKMVFDETNLKDVTYKLNGQAEIFFRKKSINNSSPTHPANQAIKNKNNLNKKESSTFAYDLIKDKRFTTDKFQFHVPITINFKATGTDNINPIVNKFIKDNPDLHIIGIDRGERHLLYVSVIDSKGNIKEQFSLNQIINENKGITYKTDYHDLLEKREDLRQKERQSWSTIEGIKELKQGYLSQVVHKISTLMVKYNAIVVLEDLNSGFKRGRQKVESSVYQQFEKALIEKLNFLVDKNKTKDELGGLLKGLQLTNKFTSFKDMKRQNGFLFYIPAWNTSKIDPVTGFVDLLHPKYESVEKARAFFCKFDKILYNNDKDYFEFSIDYNNFTTKAEGSRTLWTICTYGTRIETFRNKEKNSEWDSREVNLTDEFKKLFQQYNISENDNLKESIAKQTEKQFFEKLTHLLNLTLQMRNSKTGTEIDYLISPVADENGIFYDSRSCDTALPENADANGAYNIARKGLWVVRQIQNSTSETEKPILAISNKDWLNFAQTKPYLDI